MACGLCLGILLVFLVQAEHVGCFWTKEAQNIQNSNTYVGFPPANVRLIKSGSYPQNHVRQGFILPNPVQSSGFNTGPAVPSGSGPGHSTGSSAKVVSQPAQSSVRLVQSSSVFKANRKRPFSPRANAPNVAKQSSGLSVGWQRKNQKNPSIGSKTPPKQKGTKHSSKSLSLHGSRKSNNFNLLSLRSAAQALSKAAAKIPFYYSQVDSSASLYDPIAPGQHGHAVQVQTYARNPDKMVSSNRKSKKSKVSRFSPQTQAGKPSVGHEGSRPRSWLQTYKTNHNLAVPRSIMGAPAQGFATVYQFPQHFGGFAIRQLTNPAAQNQVTIEKLQLQIPTAAPRWLVPFIPYVQSGYPEARWTSVTM